MVAGPAAKNTPIMVIGERSTLATMRPPLFGFIYFNYHLTFLYDFCFDQ